MLWVKMPDAGHRPNAALCRQREIARDKAASKVRASSDQNCTSSQAARCVRTPEKEDKWTKVALRRSRGVGRCCNGYESEEGEASRGWRTGDKYRAVYLP